MTATTEKVGVLYVLHGGMDSHQEQYMWEASVQMFAHDRNHPVYSMVIWNPDAWPMVMQTEFAVKFMRKFDFEYERIGGFDPFHTLSDRQLEHLREALARRMPGVPFAVDFACWMTGDRVAHFAYPRFIYNGPPEAQGRCTYCGQDEPGGPWPGCDPERYNVDGPVERLLKQGATRIVAVDMTVGGARFYKTYDVIQMARRALADWNAAHGTSVAIDWVNDPTGLMERAYPTAPEEWTPTLGDPEALPEVTVSDSPNPIVADPELALLHVEGIEKSLSPVVPAAQTGVLLFNHGLFVPERRYFDPKIDDTTVLNQNIKAHLLKRHPEMDPQNIIGAYGGVKEINPENGLLERTRAMRGEDLAHAYLLRGTDDMPPAEWGYRYWEGLEYLKNRGVRHIVIGFPQVITDSVLNLVELANQIGKELGVKTWLPFRQGDFKHYPGVGHPFADYWGNWVNTSCASAPGEDVCLVLGGCSDGRPYPPPRQTPLDEKREDMDPSLAFDLCDWGHLGYDSTKGPPDPDRPVQEQYTGTWDLYRPPNDDPRLGELLARHVAQALNGREPV